VAINELDFEPEEAVFLASNFPAYEVISGTNYPVSRLKFSASGDLAAFWKFRAAAYGSGNLTCKINWYADNATSGVVRWGASIAAITPETDSQDIETDGLTTEETVDDTHLGTTSKRIMTATITVTNLDSIAAGDQCIIRIRRIGSHGNDTMANNACLTMMALSYST
jgi:hypothetical protein